MFNGHVPIWTVIDGVPCWQCEICSQIAHIMEDFDLVPCTRNMSNEPIITHLETENGEEIEL